MAGHGWVTPNADGSKARCGGPGLCPQCALELAQNSPTTRAHEHHYVFLRQETRPTQQFGGHIQERVIEDLYFCEGCLDYRRVHVRREMPAPGRMGWLEV